MKKCSKCKVEKPLYEFHRTKSNKDGLDYYCKQCKRNSYFENREEILKKSKERYIYDKEKSYDRHLKRKYGIGKEDVSEMIIKQDNKCALCNKKFTKTSMVDHCHKTGRIRGLLCRGCNGRLGWLENNKDKIYNYLESNDEDTICTSY
jgi:hypothetical protein